MKKKRKAFTLIELIIVIAILGVLAAIAIPKYNKSKIQAALTAHKTNVEMLKSAAEMKKLETDLDFKWPEDGAGSYGAYIDKWPTIPKGLKFNSQDKYTLECTGGFITIKPGADENPTNQ